MYIYTYNTDNRLVAINNPHTSISYEYNGLGDRYSQTVDGERTDYALDLASGLTQVLSDSEKIYLYGNGHIAQLDNDSTEYFLGDALSSVRQLIDENGELTLAKNYEPYGEKLSRSGDSYSIYGFTGEVYEDYIKVIDLRSRWYSPQIGRFISKDIWQGEYYRPLSLNGWNYVEGNPINSTDPFGYAPLWCGIPLIGCVDTANNAVLAAKAAYSQVGPILLALSQKDPWNNRFYCLDPRWSKPEKAIDLLADYFCERGPEWVIFNGNDALTIELAKSVLLDDVRKEYYFTGGINVPKESKFNIPEFSLALLDAINVRTGEIFFPLTHFLGSFDYSVVKSYSGRVEFQINNLTDLSSGTHIPLRYPPDNERGDPYSLEQFIQEHPEMEDKGVFEVLMDHPEIVSILRRRNRNATGFLMGGGNLRQIFNWSEKHLDCGLQKLPWPIYLPLLDIR